MSKIKESLDALQKTLEAGDYDAKRDLIQSSSPLQTIDQSDLASQFLSEKAQQALSNKAYSQVIQTPGTTDDYVCIYLSVTVKTKNIAKGVELICNSLNTLADKDLIHSTLARPASISLAKVFGQAPTSAVYSFVLVPMSRKKESEDLAIYVKQDGEMGNSIEDLSVELNEGEFLAHISVSNILFNRKPYDSSSDSVLHNKIEQYISILPKGTELVSITKCAIMDLSISYEVRFRNLLMKDYKEVRLEYRREAVRMGDDKIESFNLLTGIEYVKRDRK